MCHISCDEWKTIVFDLMHKIMLKRGSFFIKEKYKVFLRNLQFTDQH
jgi:hypothetical protein